MTLLKWLWALLALLGALAVYAVGAIRRCIIC
jgi:hypothetical protein